MLDPLKRGGVSDDYCVRIGRPVLALENKSPTAIPIYDIECGEDESIGEEETELFEQILVWWNVLASKPHVIIRIQRGRGSLWRGVFFLWRRRR